ncbi:MAG TPA: phosphatidate cytidylyltransferase [Myxococcales bacterium]|nr:phosphatidate cytidylyltransferase [Myxococcales bacterium]HBU48264.1 phosphatidate cytidylyltransferase [Myxococcales bacterium]
MNLLVRIASALVLLPIALYCIHKGGWAMIGLIAVAISIALGEAFRMVFDDALEQRVLSLLGMVMLAGLGAGILDSRQLPMSLGLMAMVVIAQAVLLILRPRTIETIPARWSAACFLPLYVGLPLLLAMSMRVHSGPDLIYLCLAVTFTNDTFAYFVGKNLGKHKLHPRVSPKKTWEGLAGGVIGSLIASFIIWHWLDLKAPWTALLAYGLTMGVLTPMGDLAESLLKRAADVKDSGRIIPGHGGVLDRIDALLFGFPITYMFALLVLR